LSQIAANRSHPLITEKKTARRKLEKLGGHTPLPLKGIGLMRVDFWPRFFSISQKCLYDGDTAFSKISIFSDFVQIFEFPSKA
jgi:hypothetical protein